MFYNLKSVSVCELFYTESIFNECLLYHLFISTYSILQRSLSTVFWGKKILLQKITEHNTAVIFMYSVFFSTLSFSPTILTSKSLSKAESVHKNCNSHFDWKASILLFGLYYKMICLILANNLCSYKDLYGICFGFLLSRVSLTTFLQHRLQNTR